MRRHEKASTAGSTQRQAGRLGRFFRGAGAMRGSSFGASGSGAPSSRRLVLPLALLVAALSLVLGVGAAIAVAPTISSTSVSAVTSKAAVLEAQINPGGEATTYHFEYGTADCSATSCTSIPVPNGNVGSGNTAVKVVNEIKGLDPQTTYHYRVVASNGSGPAVGPDRTFTTYPVTAPDETCPNKAFRVGPAASLPDCRAYEMVSPVDKGGLGIKQFEGAASRAEYTQSSPDGNKITYTSATSFGDQLGARNANQYVATRGPNGWSTHGINAPAGRTNDEPLISITHDFASQFKLFTPDLSRAWITDNSFFPLTPDAIAEWPNIYERNNLTDTYTPLTTEVYNNKSDFVGYERIEGFYEIQGHSKDFSHIVFRSKGRLTTEPAAGPTLTKLYLYSGGALHLVSVLPDGTPNLEASSVGTKRSENERNSSVRHAVSDDGSRIFWTTIEFNSDGRIFVRENPDQPQSALNGSNECTEPTRACTVPVSAGRAQFWAASADGSRAFYSEGDISNGAAEATLYEADVDAGTSTPIAAEVSGVLGASEDGSYLYFTSREALDGGAIAGEPNLYLFHGGAFTFIGTLSPTDIGTPLTTLVDHPTVDNAEAMYHASRVTADGRSLAFQSNASLTGYDNADAVNGKPSVEVYLYHADSDDLTCVSCNPSGARPVGKALQKSFQVGDKPSSSVWAAAWLTTLSQNMYAPRALSDDGTRLYFNSFDALVPRDTNGAQDVYQWEASGTGSCDREPGCVELLSSGQDPIKSEFVDASPDGRDVFIETDSSLLPQDPGLTDIYNARSGGGFPLPPPPPLPCVGDACQSVPPPPNDATPASASFKGAGDPVARKPARRCRVRGRSGKKAKAQARRQQAKRCKRANRGAGG